MDTHDDSLRSSEEEQPPLIPHPDSLELSDEEIKKLQKILNDMGGKQYNEVEAKYRGLELLRLALMLMDPKGYEYHLRHPLPWPGASLPAPPPDPPPTPQPFPIKLDADHPAEIRKWLEMLEHELRFVKRRPTHWRWALVALYSALVHTLAMHRPPTFLPYMGIGQLTKLFDAVILERPEIADAREAVEGIDRLRTVWITRAFTQWPVDAKNLPTVFLDAIWVVGKLAPDAESQGAAIDGALGRLRELGNANSKSGRRLA